MLSLEEQRACIQGVSNYIKGFDKEKLKEYILNIGREIIDKRLSLEPINYSVDNIVNIVSHMDAIKIKSKIFIINDLVSNLCTRYENDEKKKVDLLVIGAYVYFHRLLNFNITNHEFNKELLHILSDKTANNTNLAQHVQSLLNLITV